MAEDQVFFRQLAWVHPRTQVPVVAIVLQSLWTMAILLWGTYDKILNYVTSMDWIFFGLSASCLFLLGRRAPAAPGSPPRVSRGGVEVAGFRVPGHPWTTGFFCLTCAAVVVNTIYRYPSNTLIGLAILGAGVPVYYIWKGISGKTHPGDTEARRKIGRPGDRITGTTNHQNTLTRSYP